MLVVEDAYNSSSEVPRGGIGTIGNFDGVHLGQRAILGRLVERANQLGAPAVVITFDPHPLTVLAPSRAPLAITTPRQGTAFGVALSLGTTVVFLIGIQLSQAVGTGGVIPPTVAAWLPNLLFGGAALVLLGRART